MSVRVATPPGDRPTDDAAMVTLVTQTFGVPTLRRVVRVVDPRGGAVLFRVWEVFEHFWFDHPDRWWQAPLTKASVEHAERLTDKADGSGDLFYSATLEPTSIARLQDYLTYVASGRDGQRYWKSTYPVRHGQRLAREKAGKAVWPAGAESGDRNPTPFLSRMGDERSGRTPHVRDESTTIDLGWLALAALGVAAFAYERQQRAEAA